METTKVDLDDYKDKLIIEQGWICPVTQHYVDREDVEILFVNERDYAISREGLSKLRVEFGASYINDKIVHGMIIDTDKNVKREKG